jgi:hypothetical protein
MNMPLRTIRVLLVLLCASCLVLVSNPLVSGQEKDKDKMSLKSLFDGLPADLRAKVKHNPVRCDRVNDWLQENVNGKGKTIEMQVAVKKVSPFAPRMARISLSLRWLFP